MIKVRKGFWLDTMFGVLITITKVRNGPNVINDEWIHKQ